MAGRIAIHVCLLLVLLLVLPIVSGRGCSKSLLDECTGSLPLPFSLMSYSQVLSIAHQASSLDGVAQRLFAIPTGNLVNMTCAFYHGLRGCAQPVQRQCSYTHLERYMDFRTAYNQLCSMIGRINHLRNYQCLTNSTQLDTEVISCLDTFRQSAENIGNSNISSKEHLQTLCKSRQALKVCSIQAVTKVCGQYSREFWFRFNFPRDHNLESQDYCVEEVQRVTAVNQSAWLICDDGSNVVPYSYICDMEQDCFNGQDEDQCDYEKTEGLSTVAIVGIIVGILVIIVIVICLMKARKQAQFSNEYKTTSNSDTGNNGIEEI